MRFGRRAAAVVLIGLAAGSSAGATFSAATTAPRTWYVDCSTALGGSGTRARPFATTASANSAALRPGDTMLFRRGTVCRGTFVPRGGGTAAAPIVIGNYGASTAALPRIDGAGTASAVVIEDQSYITLTGLEITNRGNGSMVRRGVYFASNLKPVTGITLENLLIHDVDGIATSHGKNGGGIVGWALSRTAHFSNILIADNTIHDVARQGITVVGTNATGRPPTTRTWAKGATGLEVSGNTIANVQGDGILVLGTVGARIERNVVSQGNLAGFDHANPHKRNCAAGIWAWNANGTLIQNNEVSGMHFGPSTTPGALNGCDGEAFDVDYNQDGTIVQYNYSHDNDGGFMLLCGADGLKTTRPHHADVRYNLSVDDNSTFDVTPCTSRATPAVNNLTGIRMFNNTIVAATPRVTVQLDESAVTAALPFFEGFEFQNNIVDATSSPAAPHEFDCGDTCTNNLFFGGPAPPTATASVTADPQFVDPTLRGPGLDVAPGFELTSGSPAIGAGVAVPAGIPLPATLNYFGSPITAPPSIGFA